MGSAVGASVLGSTEGTLVGLGVGGGAVGVLDGRRDGLSLVGAGLYEGGEVGDAVPVGVDEGDVDGKRGARSSSLLGRLGLKSAAAEDVDDLGTVFSAMGIATATMTNRARTDTRIAHFNTRRVRSVFSSSCFATSSPPILSFFVF